MKKIIVFLCTGLIFFGSLTAMNIDTIDPVDTQKIDKSIVSLICCMPAGSAERHLASLIYREQFSQARTIHASIVDRSEDSEASISTIIDLKLKDLKSRQNSSVDWSKILSSISVSLGIGSLTILATYVPTNNLALKTLPGLVAYVLSAPSITQNLREGFNNKKFITGCIKMLETMKTN